MKTTKFTESIQTILSVFVTFVVTQLNTNINTIRNRLYNLLAILNQLKSYAIAQAYYVWSNKYLIDTMPHTGRSGVGDMKIVVYIIIIFLIAAILFPIAMTQVTSATTTSWGAGVGPVYAQLLPILVIVSVALHIFGFV